MRQQTQSRITWNSLLRSVTYNRDSFQASVTSPKARRNIPQAAAQVATNVAA